MGLDDSFQGFVMVTGLENLILSMDVVVKNFGFFFLFNFNIFLSLVPTTECVYSF
jgi:hypothetical protein